MFSLGPGRVVFHVMDSTGRHVRRIGLSRRVVTIGLAAAIFATSIGMALLMHGVYNITVAGESRAIRAENRAIRNLLQQTETQLAALEQMTWRSETAFAQMWSKSGLGVEPHTLGVGPIEASRTENSSLALAFNGALMDVPATGLTLEMERISDQGRSVQHRTGDLLEYFRDAERLLSNTPSVRPVSTPWITSSFGRRNDPMDGRWMMHKGLDLGGTIGMEIRSPADGVVIWVGQRGGYGHTVVVDHGYSIQTHFAHLSKYRVAVGDKVRRGEILAEMGSTGKSTGPHLHYEVRRGGQPMDPRRFILD